MKRLIIAAAMALLLIIFSACGAQPATAPTATPSTAETGSPEDDVEMSQPQIGFSLKNGTAFSDQLMADMEAACAALGYESHVLAADSAEQQKKDISSLLSSNVSVIVVEPVDVDALESELAECESDGVPVINIVDSINGYVSTLISPDYISIGKSAGERAVALYGEQGGKCLELKTDYDSFIMQLMSDGFISEIGKDSDISLTTEKYCGFDEETAYQAVKKDLSLNGTNFIFAQSAELARGAMRAIEESGKTVTLVVYGGDMDLISAVAAGKIDTAMFIDTAQITQKAVSDADNFIKNAAYVPAQYQQLDIYTVNADNAAEYTAEGALYAKVPAQ